MAAPSTPVVAYAYASRFSLREIGTWLPGKPWHRTDKTILAAEWDDGQRVFAFDFGALIFVGVPPARERQVLDALAEKLAKEPHPPLREDFLVEVDPTCEQPRISFDKLVVPSLRASELEAVATVLAQSVCIDYYDEDLEGLLRRVGELGSEVANHGKPRGSSRELIRFAGAAIAAQVEVIGSISLLDKPDFTWEDEAAERLYDLLRHHMEIPERYRAIEAKLTVVRESAGAFLELTTSRRALVLEATVVLLIFIEIVMGLWKGLH